MSNDPPVKRRRDAAQTRQDLIDVARHRFAHDGYAATTVRDIADQAGVNVALISRYFASKEGLFEACLTSAVTDVRKNAEDQAAGAEGFAARLAGHLTDPAGDDRLRTGLLLLIRTSGDERVEELRSSFLRMVSEKLLAGAGHPITDEVGVLRAQMLLAAILGLVLLRSTTGMKPLNSASADELQGPIADLVAALLNPRV
ncbi:TetR/AcrR family transcriptional regulator [Actinoplanes derwentensis]|uniref:DNA-binding transcriptional regulator, AcrR family n=1 Tax=Actinoplanes derwentensis TaxID=113562 RepID=A0A1H1RKL3_9ACTN|nr:TetR/AcrR family transcriptional regulator [Actinoplanes derwentensis]GID84433.1 TetR family transcriptional regulator [Actinoplanes derwentensis]SDS35499.1 DNA-binding transcriptional regulator, AcrR family [Actinoplanes derwentensis]